MARSSIMVSSPPPTSHVSACFALGPSPCCSCTESFGTRIHTSAALVSFTAVLRPTQEIVTTTWYDHYYGQEDSYLAVLIPNPFHPSHRSTPKTWAVPVGTEECGHSRKTCNGKLKANVQYRSVQQRISPLMDAVESREKECRILVRTW